MEDVSEQAAGGPIGQGLVEAVSASQLEENLATNGNML